MLPWYYYLTVFMKPSLLCYTFAMNEKKSIAVLGVGNILEFDDGFGVYATKFLEKNYLFTPSIDIINGGVEGINLLNLFMEHSRIIILDAIDIADEAGSIYHIPSSKLTGYGLNSGGAHEIGVLQCIDILELMGKELPESFVLGIIPSDVHVEIGLSEVLSARFEEYITALLKILQNEGVVWSKKESPTSLAELIFEFREARF
jgi:hydrogenase maturation protease